MCDGGCPKGFCKRVLFLSYGSFQLYEYDNSCNDRVLSTGDTSANSSRCWPFVKEMYIDHLSGSLKGPNRVWNGLEHEKATANCSVLQEGCLNDSQPVEIKGDQLCEYVCRLMWSVWSMWSLSSMWSVWSLWSVWSMWSVWSLWSVWSMWSMWSLWSVWSLWSMWSMWSMHCSCVSSN